MLLTFIPSDFPCPAQPINSPRPVFMGGAGTTPVPLCRPLHAGQLRSAVVVCLRVKASSSPPTAARRARTQYPEWETPTRRTTRPQRQLRLEMSEMITHFRGMSFGVCSRAGNGKASKCECLWEVPRREPCFYRTFFFHLDIQVLPHTSTTLRRV